MTGPIAPAPRRRSSLLRTQLFEAAGRGLRWVLPGDRAGTERVGRAALIAGAVAAIVTAIRLLLPIPVGIADDGAAQGILCGVSLGSDHPFSSDASTQYITTRWTDQTWYGETCPPSATIAPFSPHYALVALARLISPLFGANFDTRAFALVCAAILGVLIGLLVGLLPGRLPFRLMIATMVLLVLEDGVFADFFDSGADDGTILLGLLAAFLAFLALWRSRTVRWPGVVGAGVVSLVVCLIDARLVVLAPVFVIALLWRSSRSDTLGTPARRAIGRRAVMRRPAWLAALLHRGAAIVVSLALVAGVTLELAAVADSPSKVYEEVFDSILPYSPDPTADLRWFGLPASLASATGQPYGSSSSSAVLQNAAFARIDSGDVLLFTLSHPERLVATSDRGLQAVTSPELGYLGSYERSSGRAPWAKDRRVPVALLTLSVLHSVSLLAAGLQLIVFLLGISLAARRRKPPAIRSLGRATAFFMAMAWLLFWGTLLGDQTELARSLLPVGMITVLGIPLGLACVLALTGGGEKSASRSPNPKNSAAAATTRAAARPSP